MTRSRLLARRARAGARARDAGAGSPGGRRARAWSSRAASSATRRSRWGFKESFRAYIDGDIANGEWTTAGGATYETPEFTWSDGTGSLRPGDRLRVRAVHRIGAVHRARRPARHDDRRSDADASRRDGTGTLLLDVSGPSMEGDQIDAQDVPFVDLPGLERARARVPASRVDARHRADR